MGARRRAESEGGRKVEGETKREEVRNERGREYSCTEGVGRKRQSAERG